MTSTTQPRQKKPPLYFYALLVLIPLLFFVLLEAGLRLFDYGVNLDQWVPAAEGKLLLNPDVAKRYFHTIRNVPLSNQDIFDAVKKPNAFRVFVLGGSSAAGYPYSPLGSFSRWLQTELNILYPNCTIEVINLSMTAVNSYTLRDLFPGVIEQQPDLVLIYAGHNEYYGALGVGSLETFGSNRLLIHFTLFLNNFKTTQLVRNTVRSLASLFSSDTPRQDGTLMSRMAEDQYIEYGSDTFHDGIAQFENNIRDILEMAKRQSVPVVLGTLVSNVKDHKPFISAASAGYQPADDVFSAAQGELAARNISAADSLFQFAKDLDLLRFRAPEAINRSILRLGEEFELPVVRLDSVFRSQSPNGLIDDNFMTDHLHPTLTGYRLMAQAYARMMRERRFLPSCEAASISDRTLDSLTLARFHFTRLDSVIALYRIAILKNDWPYIEKREKRPFSALVSPNDAIEQAAFAFLTNEPSWEKAHLKAAAWYLAQKDYPRFQRQMSTLISQYPVVVEYYDYTANELMKVERYDDAHPYLKKRYGLKPDAYSAKWLGTISLSKNNTSEAIRYLEESLKYDETDAQVWYNLSGAYANSKDYQQALNAINKCLALNPAYPRAAGLQSQLLAATRR